MKKLVGKKNKERREKKISVSFVSYSFILFCMCARVDVLRCACVYALKTKNFLKIFTSSLTFKIYKIILKFRHKNPKIKKKKKQKREIELYNYLIIKMYFHCFVSNVRKEKSTTTKNKNFFYSNQAIFSRLLLLTQNWYIFQ